MRISTKQLALVSASFAAFFAVGAAANAATCESLTSLTLPHAAVKSAESITTGHFTPPGDAYTPPGGAQGFTGLPPFCRVVVQSTPTSDSLINIEIWIPLGQAWNGKYEQLGCGGFCGTLSFGYFPLAKAVRRGYASAITDDGNQSGGGAAFALGHPEKVADYGYRALKEVTDKAKSIIAALAGKGPQRSYFNGCSDGGREALMEAERFPADFDGIIAGAPASDWTHIAAGMLANEQALLSDAASYIPPKKLTALSTAVLAQCRKQDAGAPDDTFLTDPMRCKFDPTVVQCASGQDADSCLTPAQVRAAKAIYSGARNSRTGQQISPGYMPGNEDDTGNWPMWLTGSTREATLTGIAVAPTLPLSPARGGMQEFYGDSLFADFVFQNPHFDFRTADIVAATATADQKVAKLINSTDPDLRPFARHGGKIIHYHGWEDAALPPLESVDYYRAVSAALGGAKDPTAASLKRLQAFYRLFMVPGMGHCAGGPGANEFGAFIDPPVVDADHDVMMALERWVEHGVAPDKIIATHYVDNNPTKGVQFQRPLCPFPQVGRYDGKGNPVDPTSFVCRD